MSGLYKVVNSWFYIKYSIYTHALVLLIKGMCDTSNLHSFGTVLTTINEIFKGMVYVVDDIIFS